MKNCKVLLPRLRMPILKQELLPPPPLQSGISAEEFTAWKENLISYVSENQEWRKFLKNGSYETWTPLAEATNGQRITELNPAHDKISNARLKAKLLKKINQLLSEFIQFLCKLASPAEQHSIYAVSNSFDVIMQFFKDSRSMDQKPKNILQLRDIDYTENEDFHEFYQRFRKGICTNLKKKGDIANDDIMQEDEIISPTFEDVIVMWTLEKIDSSLPTLVFNTFGLHLVQGSSLKQLQEEIFEFIPELLQEKDVMADNQDKYNTSLQHDFSTVMVKEEESYPMDDNATAEDKKAVDLVMTDPTDNMELDEDEEIVDSGAIDDDHDDPDFMFEVSMADKIDNIIQSNAEILDENNPDFRFIPPRKCTWPDCNARPLRHKRGYDIHMERHEKRAKLAPGRQLPDKWPCYKCECTFERRPNLLRHLRSGHEIKHTDPNAIPYEVTCPYCGKRCPSQASFDIHLKVRHVSSSGDMPQRKFPCQVCGQRFSRRSRRRVHEKKEHPDQDLKESDQEEEIDKLECVHCTRVFYEQPHLDLHVQKHIEDNLYMPFACSICGLGLKLRKLFLRHMQLRHGDKIDGNELKYFIVKKITCNFCEAKFVSRDEFSEHVQERHPPEKEDAPKDTLNETEIKETAPTNNINIEAASIVILDNIVKDTVTNDVASNVEIVATDKAVPSNNIDIVATYSEEDGKIMEFILPSNDILEQAITQELNTNEISVDLAKNTDENKTVEPGIQLKDPSNNYKLIIKQADFISCQICVKILQFKNFRDHCNEHYSEGDFGDTPCQCDICSESFQDEKFLVAHILELNHVEIQPADREDWVGHKEEILCPLCEKKMSRFSLVKHMRGHRKGEAMLMTGVWKCAWCQDECGSNDDLLNHVKNVHRNTEVELPEGLSCPECGQQHFYSETKLREHRYYHHNPYITNVVGNKCYRCELEFPNHIKLLKHMKTTEHGEDKVIITDNQCLICFKFGFVSDKTVQNHLLKIHREERNKAETDLVIRAISGDQPNFVCESCGKCFLKKQTLIQHNKNHHKKDGDKPVLCPECGKVLGDIQHLERHMKLHQKDQIECQKCSRKFASDKTFQRHKERCETGRQWKPKNGKPKDKTEECGVCKRNFYSKYHQDNHICKPNVCNICSEAFVRVRNLDMHMLSHNGVEVLKCDQEGCEALFKTRKYVAAHKREFHVKKHASNCKICGVFVTSKHNMKSHMRKQHLTPAVKINCEICGRQVKTEQNLKIHMQNHDKNRLRFECAGKCGLSFVDFNYMQKHYEIMRCGKKETNPNQPNIDDSENFKPQL